MIPFSMNKLSVLALSALLAGCTLAPRYERPDAPVDAAYPTGPAYGQPTPLAAGQPAAADIGWRDFFHDPLLHRLIEMALANNRDLRVAALNVEAARAQYRIQRAEILPTIGGAGEASVQRLPADLSQSGQSMISRSYQVGIATSAWELDLFGRIRSLSQQALENYLSLDETRIATHLSLIAEVANAYLTLRADQELLRITGDTLAAQKASYDLTKQRFDAGVSTDLDLSQAEIALRTAESNFATYTRLAAQDRNALVLLLGQPLPADLSAEIEQAQGLPDGIVSEDLPAGLPSDLLVRRPDIRAAEHTLRGANANIGAARAAFFPTISLTGSAGTASASLGGLFEGGSGAWSFAPQITLPIFAGGSLRANLDLAQVQKRIEIANYEKAIQTGFREVADGLAGKRTLDEQIRSERQLVQASQRAYNLSEQRFKEGVDDYLSVLDSQRSLYSAQQSLVNTRLTRLSNLIGLYKALGGGWTERTVAPAPAAQVGAPG